MLASMQANLVDAVKYLVRCKHINMPAGWEPLGWFGIVIFFIRIFTDTPGSSRPTITSKLFFLMKV